MLTKKIIPVFSKCMSYYCPHLIGLSITSRTMLNKQTSRTMLNKHCPEPSIFPLTLKGFNSGVIHKVHWVEIVFIILNKYPSFSRLVRFYFIKLLKILGIVKYIIPFST